MTGLSLPAPYPWPEGRSAAFCFSVDVDAHSPWLWANRSSMPRGLSHLEQRNFGPRLGLPRIAELLLRHNIHGSFFVPAVVAEEYPDILPGLLDGGHEVGLHGYFHELAGEITDDEFTQVLEASVELFERQTGARPKGFRSPAWEMTAHMLAEVRRLGFYDSSLMGLDTPYSINGVTEVPVQWSTDDAIFFKFLGGAGNDRWPPLDTNQVLAAWEEEFSAIHRFGGLFMLTVHDWISGRAPRIAMLERFLATVTGHADVWITTAGELATHHHTHASKRDDLTVDVPASLLQHPVWRGQ
ncbi:MAG: polysaccharide deacetylase family protein [Devosia sp.]